MSQVHHRAYHHRNLKERVAELMRPASREDRVMNRVDKCILALIFMNLIAVVLETVDSLRGSYASVFRWFEFFSMIVFTTEYLLRMWACTSSKKYKHPVRGRIRYALTPFMLLDFLVLLPFYLAAFIAVDLRFVRALRLFRLLVVFKLVRYSHSLKLFIKVAHDKKEELAVTFGMILMMLLFASCIIFFLEHQRQPEAFSSIPAAMWWAVSTMTTVGYGDVYPMTTLGKFFGGFVALLGLGMFGLPAAILVTGFLEEVQKHRRHPKHCPHCKKPLE